MFGKESLVALSRAKDVETKRELVDNMLFERLSGHYKEHWANYICDRLLDEADDHPEKLINNIDQTRAELASMEQQLKNMQIDIYL